MSNSNQTITRVIELLEEVRLCERHWPNGWSGTDRTLDEAIGLLRAIQEKKGDE